MSDKKEFLLPAKTAVQTDAAGNSIACESGGEFVLPDYLPKVQKVLRTEARVLPPTRYMNTGAAQMSGSVLHTLIYLGEDGEIGATVLPAKYEFSVPFSEDGETPSVSASVDVDSLSYRVSGPRKLSIRTRLRAKPRILADKDIAEKQLPAGNIAGLHKLYSEADSIRTLILRSSDIALSDVIDIGGGEETRPIWCGSTAAVHDVRAMEGGVSVRGDVCVKVLLDDGGTPKMVMKKLPFEEFIDGDVQKGATATAVARILSTEVAKEQNGEAAVDVLLAVEATVDTPCKITVTRDAFSELSEGKVTYRKVPTSRLLLNRSGVYTVGGSVAKTAVGAAGLAAVLDTAGEATLEETAFANGRLTLSGKCALNTIYTAEDGEIASADYSVPFKITLDCDTPDGAVANACVSLLSARTRADGENLVCDMDVAVCVRAAASGETDAVEQIDLTAQKVYAKSDYPLCLIYPRGDSLWNVAKKYHVAPERLAKVNALSDADPSMAVSAGVLMLEL